MNKKLLWLFIALLFLMCSQVVSADVADGQYDVTVRLLKAYEDGVSMGNGALQSSAKLIVSGGQARLRIELNALDFMDFTGYLGQLTVDNRTVDIIATYDVFDQYNDPQNGIDEKIKGLAYPKTVEFPIDIGQEIIACTVYVPVMAEMGSGSQKARIAVNYPADLLKQLNAPEQTTTEQVDNEVVTEVPTTESVTAATQVEAGTEPADPTPAVQSQALYYRLPVALWHAHEDKPSMGNNAIGHFANLLVDGEQMKLYISAAEMSLMNINTSLVDLYYDNGDKYLRAERADFSLQIGDLAKVRPRVFIIPLRDKTQFLDVMVDPKVEAMGEEPIAARLKLDFDRAELIDKAQSELLLAAQDGAAQPLFDPAQSVSRVDKGITLEAAAGTFKNDFNFYADALHGEALTQIEQDYAAQLPQAASIEVYTLRALGDLAEIPHDTTTSINTLRQAFQPEGQFSLTIPLAKKGGTANLALYAMEDVLKPLDYQWQDSAITFSYDKFVPFAVVQSTAGLAEQASTSEAADLQRQVTVVQADRQVNNSVSNVSVQPVEQPAIIMLGIVILLSLLSAGIYFSIKHYKVVLAELQYAAELEKAKNGALSDKEQRP